MWNSTVHLRHKYTLIQLKNVRYKRSFLLIEVFNVPIRCWFPSTFAWMSFPSSLTSAQQSGGFPVCEWLQQLQQLRASCGPGGTQAGRGRINVLMSEGDKASPVGPQPPCCTLSIPLISLHWLVVTSLSAEEVSGFFHLLEIKIPWRSQRQSVRAGSGLRRVVTQRKVDVL